MLILLLVELYDFHFILIVFTITMKNEYGTIGILNKCNNTSNQVDSSGEQANAKTTRFQQDQN